MPGQNRPRAIEAAIETSDFFLPCFSRNSVSKWGGFRAEIRYALDCARRVPLDEIFIVPVRLDDCRVPRRIQRELQYIDLFPEWTAGVRQNTTVVASPKIKVILSVRFSCSDKRIQGKEEILEGSSAGDSTIGRQQGGN